MIINDGDSHFCNKSFKALQQKYGVCHNVATPYHLQFSGKFEFPNKEIKQIFSKTVNTNRINWSRSPDEALYAYHTVLKTSIGMSSYQLIYGKSCHLLVEVENKGIWVLNKLNVDWGATSNQRANELNDLNEFLLRSYESSAFYKENMYHDQKIENAKLSWVIWCFYSTLGCIYFLESLIPSGTGHL